MTIETRWEEIRILFEKTIKKNSYYAFATVDKNGNPHITPIGSLILEDGCTGFFFDRFPKQMKSNFETCQRVAVMTINNGFLYWFKAIRKGRFDSPPGIRLYGKVGDLRQADDREIAIWQKKIKRARGTKGYDILWKDMSMVRDIYFDDFRLVKAGKMTANLWGQ